MFFIKKVMLFLYLLTFTFSFILIPYSFADDYIEPIDNSDDILSTIPTSVSSVPNINSRAAIVLERSTKTILFGKNELDIRKMASTTKIMTAIIVLENETNLTNIVTISSKAANTGGSRLGLSPNCQISVIDLLYGLMLCSGNDAAVALAEYISGSIENFADLMNNKANSLQLTNTHFVTPHGLDNENHYTTAYELALLTDYALKNETFCKLANTCYCTITINGKPKNIHTTNELLGISNGIYGVKTGFTNGANRCLVTAYRRDDLDIVCVVLGADTKKFRTQDTIKLVEYTFKNFGMINIEDTILNNFNSWKSDNLSKFNISKSTNSIDIYLSELPYKYFPCSINKGEIRTNISANYNFIAPLSKDYKIGSLDVFIDNKIICSLEIKTANTIIQKNVFDYLTLFFKNYTNYLEYII